MLDLGPHTIQIAAASHVGQVRQQQEDAFLVGFFGENGWSWGQGSEGQAVPASILLAVADGMGGLNAGEVASAIAIEEVQKNLQMFGNVEPFHIKTVLRQAILNAHFAIETKSKKGEGEMGSTLIVAWLVAHLLYVAWVGDSRCYLYRAGEGLRPLTKDHSLVQEMVDKGSITEEEAFFHPKRNVVTQSLGISGHDPEPDYVDIILKPGDTILLCSDGLNTMLTDPQMEHIFNTADSPAQATTLLVETANAAGGQDNITVVLASVKEQAATLQNQVHPVFQVPISVQVPPAPARKRSQKLIFLMLPLVAILAALTIWTATREKPKELFVAKQDTLDNAGAATKAKAIAQDSAAADDSLSTSPSATDFMKLPKDSLVLDSVTLTGNYVIQVNTLSNEKNAQRSLRKLQAVFPGREIKIVEEDGKYKVLLTGFGSRSEAEQFQAGNDRLKKSMIYLKKDVQE